DKDKEIGDSVSLRPILSDFRAAHPNIHFKTFLGDSSFDSYDIYSMLKNEFSFERACIPMNPRNSKASSSDFDTSGTPICPVTGMPFLSVSLSPSFFLSFVRLALAVISRSRADFYNCLLFIRRNHRYYENVRLPMHHLLYSLFGCSANCIASALLCSVLLCSALRSVVLFCMAIKPLSVKNLRRISHLMYRPASADS
ncbi:MAG: hypothetical protein IJ119_03145, partial [Clostridia bacterium]|nr:hypothetical protein [Clostridia bacterium]